MTRTSTEHELVIDILDDLLTFGYAHEGARTKNEDLNHLQAFAHEVRREMEKDSNKILFLMPGERDSTILRVMNRLQFAIRKGVPPKAADFGRAWANKPAVLKGTDLYKAHAEQANDLLQLVTATIDRLGTAFPSEARPFITRDQVTASVCHMLLNPHYSLLPIHVEILGGLLHQAFLAELEYCNPPHIDSSRWIPLVEKYIDQAEFKFVEMVTDDFEVEMIRELFPRAKKLTIPIDQNYSWGALLKKPMLGAELLKIYAKLNIGGAVEDAKYEGKIDKKSDAGISADKFIKLNQYHVPKAARRSTASEYQIYFSTDGSNISINGKAIQKHAVMAIRYDKPLRDIEIKMKHFSYFLHNLRRRQLANSPELNNVEEAELLQHIRVDAVDRRKSERVVLHDKSSVLSHICIFLYIQLMGDSNHKDMPKKALIITIQEILQKSNFKYGIDSIRKACDKRDEVITAVRHNLERVKNP